IRKVHLVLSNTGEKPAEDIDLFVTFPTDIKLLKSKPKEPKAPERPQKTQQEFLMPWIPKEPVIYQVQNRILEDEETTVDVDISKSKVSIHQKSLKHGHWVTIGIWLEFSEIWKVNPQIIPVDYLVTVANLPKEIEGTLLIEIIRIGS